MRRKSIAMALCATVVCAGLGAAQLSSFASEAETGTDIQAENEDSDLTSAFSTISTTDEVEPIRISIAIPVWRMWRKTPCPPSWRSPISPWRR